jgi:hypothetical protein
MNSSLKLLNSCDNNPLLRLEWQSVEKILSHEFNSYSKSKRLFETESLPFLRQQLLTILKWTNQLERIINVDTFLETGTSIIGIPFLVSIQEISIIIQWWQGILKHIILLRSFWDNGLLHCVSQHISSQLLQQATPHTYILRFTSIKTNESLGDESKIALCCFDDVPKKNIITIKDSQYSMIQDNGFLFTKATLEEILLGIMYVKELVCVLNGNYVCVCKSFLGGVVWRVK